MEAQKYLYYSTIYISVALVVLTGAPAASQTTSNPQFLILSPQQATLPSVTLTAGEIQNLRFEIGGVVASNARWVMSPNIGQISNSVYTAPASLFQATTIILMASSGGQSAMGLIKLQAPNAALPPINLSPSSVSLTAGGTVQFHSLNTGLTPVLWSISPSVGSIVNGLYTAPQNIAHPQTVTVRAMNSTNSSQTGTATVSLASKATTPTPPTPAATTSISPGSTSLGPSASAQFNFLVNGALNTNVTWSMVPQLGSVTNGFYTAPATISSQASITLIATSTANSSETASASINLVPPKPAASSPVGITVVPPLVTLAPGGSSSFTANVTGTTNTAVTWSISPDLGTLKNGIYTAPTTVTSVETIALTATSVANPAQSAKAMVVVIPVATTVSVSPTQVSLGASKTQQFTATESSTQGIGGAAPPTVQWSISPSAGKVSSTGLYTAPSTVSTQQVVTITATAGSSRASASVTLTPGASTTPTSPTTTDSSAPGVTLPIEVMGPAGTTGSFTFTIPSTANLSGPQQLWLQIHGLRYQTEASVQMNSGSWLAINDSTVTLQGLASAYGGIGGGFGTLKLTMNLPAGSVKAGSNTLHFRFNGTDGIVSGFRVINLNILGSDGSQLIPPGSLASDDPSTWQPPLTSASDIQAGETLWKSAALNSPATGAMQAHCSDCHAADGRDLKYFNYSNYSIEARSVFHGLTSQQGQQIASYIRTLNAPAPATARPWNPPYQPGPGLDSQPVENWSAGAGLDAVLDSDSEMVQYLMPGGSTSNLSAAGFLNQRELPLSIQLMDWNRWLPTIHPLDAWGATFTTSKLHQLYQALSSNLVADSAASYKNQSGPLAYWALDSLTLDATVERSPSWNDPIYVQKVYSTGLWAIVKNWEINQRFGLEGMPQVPFGPTAEARAWFSQMPFMTSPNMMHIPNPAKGTAGIANGKQISSAYASLSWYELQLIVNDGNGHFQGGSPIDFPYVYSVLTSIGNNSSPKTAQGALLLSWMTKALQLSETNGGPQLGSEGWNFLTNDASQLVLWPGAPTTWDGGITSSERIALINNYLTQWLSKVNSFTPAEIYAGKQASANDSIKPADADGPYIGDKIAYMIPQLLYWGAEQSLVSQVEAWAKTVWPSYNWASALSASCGPRNGTIVCSNDH